MEPVRNNFIYDTKKNTDFSAQDDIENLCEDMPSPEQYEPDEEFRRVWKEIYDQRNPCREEANAGPKGKAYKRRRVFTRISAAIFAAAALYCAAVFSDIPFIAKWRTIYIETAMSTMNHQWLATAFIPKSVIEKVVDDSNELEALQSGISSHWSVPDFEPKGLYLTWSKEKSKFPVMYPEIDQQSFNDYLNKHPGEFINKDQYLVIDKAGLNDQGTSIKTVYGDQVLAIDTENAIEIIKVTGEGYVGRLAIVKDPSRVGLGLSKNFDKSGQTVGELAKYNNAVLAINASGFYDPDGTGNGGNADGLVVSNGKLLKNAKGYSYKTIGFDKENKLNIGNYKSLSPFRDAVEFKPALIIDGKVLVTGSDGWGIQPRSAIGQTKNGDILLLIVDGRAPGYSIGCTVGELAKIMQRYGAYQACNLDGGSSSLLYYNGREISKPSAANKVNGRDVPNGFVVYNRKK